MSGYRRIVAWGLTLLSLGCELGRVDAAPLDPNSSLYTAYSQGDIVLASGSYSFVLGTAGPSLIMYNGPTFTTVATGFVSNGINIFDFHSLQIQAGANITVTQSSASGPIALLSSTSINMAGTINVSPDPTSLFGGPGAANLYVGGHGATGQSPGVSGPGGLIITGGGGGGFGGAGQSAVNVPIIAQIPGQNPVQTGTLAGGGGGSGYVNLYDQIRGGSAGGLGGGYATPGTSSVFTGSPGQGGGGIELGAAGLVSVSGTIHADGGSAYGPANQFIGGGGGGSGGGVLIHGYDVNLSGTISALGGTGGLGGLGNAAVYSSNGGNGGGGLVMAVSSGTPGSYTNTASILVGNGRFDVAAVPEPSSLILLGIAGLGGATACWRRQARQV